MNDKSLNCSFSDLFENINIEGVKIDFVDCPVGFPEDYPRVFLGNHRYTKGAKSLVRWLKNILKRRLLNTSLKAIRDKVNRIDDPYCMYNSEFQEVYASKDYVSFMSAREMDNLFISKIEGRLNEKFNSGSNFYVNSCYRLFPLEDHYKHFTPKKAIAEKINATKNKFKSTYGLHIRRTDHII